MQDNIKDIKQDIKDLWVKIETSFENLPKHFPTREEHNYTKDKLKRVEKVFWWVLALFGTAIIGSILKLILL